MCIPYSDNGYAVFNLVMTEFLFGITETKISVVMKSTVHIADTYCSLLFL
jgi:hypothetical protein